MNNIKHLKNSILKIFRYFIDEFKIRDSDKSNISASKIVSSETVLIHKIKEKEKKRKNDISIENINPPYSVKKVTKKDPKKKIRFEEVKPETIPASF